MPSSAAFWFIRATKLSSLPLTSRASVSQHSAPEGSIAPYNKSCTVTVSPGTKPAMEAFSACKVGKIPSGKVTCLSRSGSASMASSIVIILVSEAGAARSSARFCASTCPLWASSKIACLLAVSSKTFCLRNNTSSTSKAARIHSHLKRRWNRFMIDHTSFLHNLKRFHLSIRGKSAFPCKSATYQNNKKALRNLSELFVKSATTYFHKPFPANYLRHK